MKKYTPATSYAEYCALVNKLADLRQIISILNETVREGGYFAETAAKQIPLEEAEAHAINLAIIKTPTRYNSFLETTEVVVAR